MNRLFAKYSVFILFIWCPHLLSFIDIHTKFVQQMWSDTWILNLLFLSVVYKTFKYESKGRKEPKNVGKFIKERERERK